MNEHEWDRYSVICYIVKNVAGSNRLGKKALQKYVYLLKDLKSVDLGYNFRFYTYGPFSSSLAADIDIAGDFGALAISYNETDNYYSIMAGPEIDRFIAKGEQYLAANKSKIDEVLKNFGGRFAKDLELIATLVFVLKNSTERPMKLNALIAETHALKPKFSEEKIRRTINELTAKKYFKPISDAKH